MKCKNKLVFLFVCALIGCNGNKVKESQRYFEIGKKQEELHRLDSATLCYRKAIDLLPDNKKNYELKGEICNRLGSVLLETDLYPEAYEVYKTACEYNIYCKDKTNLSVSLRGIGKSFAFQDKPDSAVNYFLKALELSPSIKDSTELLLINNNLSMVYKTLSQYEKALYYNNIAMLLSKDSATLYRNCFIRGDIFMECEQYDSAYYYYELGSHSSILQTQTASCWRLYEFCSKFHLSDSSKYLKLFISLNDSIDRSSQTVQIQSTNEKYLKNKAENKYRRIIGYILCGLAIPLVFLGLLNYRHKRKLKMQEEKNQKNKERILRLYEEITELKQELDSLKERGRSLSENVEKSRRLEEIQNNLIENIQSMAVDCTGRFKKSDDYKEIRKQLNENKFAVTEQEKQKIFKKVTAVYEPFIFALSTFTEMVKEDAYLCCLTLSGFTTKESSLFRGVSWEAIRSQKSRIKRRICTTFLSEKLFMFIFEKS